MLRKLVYKNDDKIYLMHPFDVFVEKGSEIIAENKEQADQLKELGFKEVAEGKKEIEKEGDK